MRLLPPYALIFSSKCTKMHLAAGLRPDPLGELKRSPDPLAPIRGPTSKERGREGRRGREEREGKGRGGRGLAPPQKKFLVPPLPGGNLRGEFGRQLYDTTPHYMTSKRITNDKLLSSKSPLSFPVACGPQARGKTQGGFGRQ